MIATSRIYATPLRYPGGKQKLAPFVAEILEANALVGGAYAEPYAGGAGVAIELLVRGLVSEIHINDSDEGVYAFWYCVKHHNKALRSRIANAVLSVDEWRRQKAILRSEKSSPLDRGFALFYLNRVNRSGIMNGGLIGGLAQTGKWLMDARYNRADLVRRVQVLGHLSDKIQIYAMDALDFISVMAQKLPRKSLIYLDPPYYHKADRLYRNYYRHSDHLRVREAVKTCLRGKAWIVSYDNTPEIAALYSDNAPIVYNLQYSAGKVFVGKEFMAFSDGLKVPFTSSVRAIAIPLEARAHAMVFAD